MEKRPLQMGGAQPAWKKQKPNTYNSAPQSTAARDGRTGFSNSIGRSPQFFKEKNNPLELIERLPDPQDCVQCHLVAAETDNGLVALLDQLAYEEAGPKGDQMILKQARELRNLLYKRSQKKQPAQLTRTLDQKRPETGKYVRVPSYVAEKLNHAKTVPPLPPIDEPYLEDAVFTHSSTIPTNVPRRLLNNTSDYERLEFLGDAYIELIASRLIYSRFPHLEPSKQSYLRENLVKNETLQIYSEAYRFPDRLKHGGHTRLAAKAWTKVQADVFEAYVAAIVLSDPDNGYATAEKWLTELWTPKLLEFREAPLENPRAREELMKLIMAKGIKVEYRMEKDMQMVNGVQKFFMGIYLTGWGFENQWLGSGEGQNKSQACIIAAMDALENRMHIIMKANEKKLELYPPKPKEDEEQEETKPDEEDKLEEKPARSSTEGQSINAKEPTSDTDDEQREQLRREKKAKKKEKKEKKEKREKKRKSSEVEE